jgi:hypothetical protein
VREKGREGVLGNDPIKCHVMLQAGVLVLSGTSESCKLSAADSNRPKSTDWPQITLVCTCLRCM